MDERRTVRLSRQESAACLIAERVLGATADPWDVGGRQGAVDAMLTLADGRRAAFEVTAHAEAGALQIDALLGRDNFEWPAAGKWHWSIQVGSPADIPRLRESYRRIGTMCEEAGVDRAEMLRRHQLQSTGDIDPDVRWLTEESSSTLFIHFGLPAVEDELSRPTTIVPAGRGGAVDAQLAGLRQAVDDMLAKPTMRRHIEKLSRATADERHLFVPIHRSALPYAVADGLWTGTTLPSEPPALPDPLTHLWLAPELGQRVLLGNSGRWTQYYPYYT